MSVPDSENHHDPRSPIEHLRAFASRMMEPQRGHEQEATETAAESSQLKPFRGRNVLVGGEDKTIKLLFAAAGAVVVIVLLMLGLSHKHAARKAQANAPAIGNVQSSKTSSQNIVPRISMQPTPPAQKPVGHVTAQDLEGTEASASNSSGQTRTLPGPAPSSLAGIKPFNAGQTTTNNWSPQPYSGQQEAPRESTERNGNTALAKPSLVFVAHSASASSSGEASGLLAPTLDLAPGTRLVARLDSLATTAVDLPVTADIEYSYERDGVILVPAGSTAVGHIQQADRSGYLLIKFTRLEIPHQGEVSIDAVATTPELGPLKGKVTGTHTGRNFLVRTFADVGSGIAMFAGQNNTSGAISEDDLLRAQLAENAGSAGDQEIMQLMLTEHPIVSVAAHTPILVVFEKIDNNTTGNDKTAGSRLSQPSLTQLRQLLELERDQSQKVSAGVE